MNAPSGDIYETVINPEPGQNDIIIEDHDGDLQVIECAKSGKTESISRSVAEIQRRGSGSEAVVAFRFVDKAAIELKQCITKQWTDNRSSHLQIVNSANIFLTPEADEWVKGGRKAEKIAAALSGATIGSQQLRRKGDAL